MLGLSDMSVLYRGHLLLTSDLPGIYEDIKRDAQDWRHQLARSKRYNRFLKRRPKIDAVRRAHP